MSAFLSKNVPLFEQRFSREGFPQGRKKKKRLISDQSFILRPEAFDIRDFSKKIICIRKIWTLDLSRNFQKSDLTSIDYWNSNLKLKRWDEASFQLEILYFWSLRMKFFFSGVKTLSSEFPRKFKWRNIFLFYLLKDFIFLENCWGLTIWVMKWLTDWIFLRFYLLFIGTNWIGFRIEI